VSGSSGSFALTNEFLEYEIRAYLQQCNYWTAYRAVISALTDNVRTFVIKLSHNWLPVAFGNADAALRLIPALSAFNPKPYLTCTSATLGHLEVHRSAYEAPQRRIY
jgi:hypothetical protein